MTRPQLTRQAMIDFAASRGHAKPTYVGGRAFYELVKLLASKDIHLYCTGCNRGLLDRKGNRVQRRTCCEEVGVGIRSLRKIRPRDLDVSGEGNRELQVVLLIREYLGYE